MSFDKLSTEQLQLQLKAANRLLAIEAARDSLLAYTKLTMPDPEDIDDATRSGYEVKAHHKLIAEALEKVEKGEILRLAISVAPQHGKLVADDTPVMTSAGWKTHGELQPGDEVFGPDGQPTEVVAVSEPGVADYEVEFTDGAKIRVHGRHEWTVRMSNNIWRTLETQDLASRTIWYDGRGNGARFFVHPVPRVETCELPLVIPPYVLGAWLGDGTSVKGCITHAPTDTEVIEEVVRLGYAVRVAYTHKTTGVLTTYFHQLAEDLQTLGVFDNKHIPGPYLAGSVEQRLQLLAGLLDTDGYIYRPTKRAVFSNTNRRLIDDVARLVRSLGWRATIAEALPTLSTSGIQGKQIVYQCSFSPDGPIPTRIRRKQVDGFSALRRARGIRAIRRCDPAPGKCVQVGRMDGLYCVGEHLIPTHNSELVSRKFPAWYSGRNPSKDIIFATYNQEFADEFGAEVRDRITSQTHRAVFPKCKLRSGSAAKDLLVTTLGGHMAFLGRGGSGTGKSADLVIIDDPLKNADEAESPTTRKKLHDWFSKVIYSRVRTTTAIVILATRWHEDDLIGRLCDPEHPEHDAELAKEWVYLNLPAVVKDKPLADALGLTLEMPREERVRQEFGAVPMTALWPEQFSLMHLASAHRLNKQTFNALYMGRPTPEDGDYFKKDWLLEYKPEDLPKNLRKYGASDHATSEDEANDASVIGCVGVDDNNHIWVLPDLVWDRIETDRTVEELLHQIQTHRPLLWWMETDMVSKSFGPFLRKRMQETNTYVTIDASSPSKDKRMRARSIQGRLSMKVVHFPGWMPWWNDAKSQLLKFPFAAHDDFVDWLSWIGLGLTKEVPAAKSVESRRIIRTGSIEWVKRAAKLRADAEARRKAANGWA